MPGLNICQEKDKNYGILRKGDFSMIEEPIYFKNGNYELFGIFYKPEESIKKTGFVFSHPFIEEKLWTQRVFVNFARELAQKGYPVFRFDFMGHGDSEGDFENSTVESRLSDMDKAIEKIMTEFSSLENIGLLGLRLGASLAAIKAETHPLISKLILWEPIVNGSDYMQEILRINLTTQTAVYKEIIHNREALVEQMKNGNTVNIDGYEIPINLFQQVSDINLIDDTKSFTGSGLTVQISRNDKRINKKFETLKTLYQNMNFQISIEEPFWKEIKIFYSKANNLFNDTLKWLELNDK